MVETERAFAVHARAVGWKQAFLEYFADDAVGFDEDAGLAKDQIRRNPDPPRELQLLWEPRYGDLAAGGDLGYLTGPVTSINPARNGGMPRYSAYASVWKRQPDRTFRVVMDVGIATPAAVPFAPGFTRAPIAGRYTGGEAPDTATRSLSRADVALTTAATSSQEDAYRDRIADGGRIHRPGIMPLVGEAAGLAWLQTQPSYSSGVSRYAAASSSGDLGYTWGSYAVGPSGAGPAARGFYMRIWVRSRDASWKVALDMLQPQP